MNFGIARLVRALVIRLDRRMGWSEKWRRNHPEAASPNAVSFKVLALTGIGVVVGGTVLFAVMAR